MQVKFIISGLLCFICSGPLYADYDVSNLQKLFTDKKQRAQIDAMRSGNDTKSDIKQKTGKVNINGYITRSNGKSVVWVNNKSTLDSPKIGAVKVQQSNIGKNKKVAVTLDGKHAQLKPGESWNVETGKIVDRQ
jgi:hypothetical protein